MPHAADTTTNHDRHSTEVYHKAVRTTFAFLKSIRRLDSLYASGLGMAEDYGPLVPICELHDGDDRLIELLAAWRAANAEAYPTRFPVTIGGTASWLRSKLLDVEDRLLFLVLDRHGHPVGHLGYANCLNDRLEMEIDNVVRGVAGAAPGIMAHAMRTVLDWAEETIGPRGIFLRVLSDNRHAIEFYRRLGFSDGSRTPLRKHVRGETTSYEPCAEDDTAPPDAEFLRMDYAPNRTFDGSRMILTAGPSISAREASYALDAARHGWNYQWNGYIDRFETSFADRLGVRHALTTSSCTGALHLALAACGIGPGDEVIVPDLTWVATANAVLYVDAVPVFADVDPNTWCLDPASFQSHITDRTRAVIPVHLYGHPAQMDRIVEIARAHKLLVIEDAAASLGARYRGTRVGTFGDFAAFSFQGAKVLVTGEGGMLVTDNPDLFAKVRKIWDQGRVPGTFWIEGNGLKYKMSNVQAAIGLGQLERLDELVAAKRRIFSWYREGLGDYPLVTLNEEREGARSSYWMSSIRLADDSPLTRDELRERLAARKVDTRPVFPAISQYPFWPRKQDPQPVARSIGEHALNLPSGVCLKRHEVDYVCRVVREILG
jgi:perosamine synthetase